MNHGLCPLSGVWLVCIPWHDMSNLCCIDVFYVLVCFCFDFSRLSTVYWSQTCPTLMLVSLFFNGMGTWLSLYLPFFVWPIKALFSNQKHIPLLLKNKETNISLWHRLCAQYTLVSCDGMSTENCLRVYHLLFCCNKMPNLKESFIIRMI